MTVTILSPNSPLINNFRYSTGDLAGQPLDAGTIDFFENDNRTTRQDTFSDSEGTILNDNPLVASDVGTLPPIYMIDNPYYIVIKDKFGNTVATLENYLPGGESGGGASTNTNNLFPSLGFESQVFSDIFNETDRSLSSGKNDFSLGWVWEIATTATASNYYTFTPLNNSGIDGNPRNFITFFSSNNTTGDSLKRVYTKIGGYNSLQGIQLQLSVYLRLIVGGFSTLNVIIFRQKAGVDQPPISAGSITVPTGALEPASPLIFTIAPLVDSDYTNNDGLFLGIEFPLNQDFQLEMTATWLQESPNNELNVSEENHAINLTKMLWNVTDAIESPNYNQLEGGSPLVVGRGGLHPSLEDGLIKIGIPNHSYNNYYNMETNVELISSNVDAPAIVGVQGIKDDTETNRLISLLREAVLTGSTHTFVGTPTSTNQIDWRTGIGTKEFAPWTASAGGRVTLTKSTDELVYHLQAHHKNNTVRFTFTENFTPGTAPYEPNYAIGVPPGTGGLLYATPPTSHPIVSWLGDNQPTFGVTGAGLDIYQQNQRFIFKPSLKVTTIALGAPTEPAIVDRSARQHYENLSGGHTWGPGSWRC